MIVDSSAAIALLVREPVWERLAEKLARAETCAIGAPTLAETGVVLSAKMGRRGATLLSRFLHEAGLVVVPFTEEHWPVAVEAYTRFGKGRHAAALNFGDCLTYAIARLSRQPLLYVGDDFAKTDLSAA